MADRLTQLQDCLDDLLTQMYASLSYIQTRHPYGDISGQPNQAPNPVLTTTNNANGTSFTNGISAQQPAAQQSSQTQQTQPDGQLSRPLTPPPETPDAFTAALHELAQDLVVKEQQIEYLINSLPGLGNSEPDQLRRLEHLEGELRQADAERANAEKERETMINALASIIVGARRAP